MRWNLFNVPRRQTQDDRYLQELLNSKGEDEQAIDRQVKFTLLAARWRAAIAPYLRVFKLAKEVLHGKYRTAATQVHGGAHQASGGNFPAGAGYALPSPGGAIASFTVTNPGSGYAAPARNSTFEDAGIRAGEVTGYRCWELRDGLLYSMWRSEFCWPPGEIVEGNPDIYGEGVHAFKDRLGMGAYGYNPHPAYPVVSGTIEMWGDVYEHEQGYRASKVAIASIDDSPHYDAKALRKLYGLTSRHRQRGKRRPKNKS